MRQGYHNGRLLASRQEISEVLETDDVSEADRQQLELVQRIRVFAAKNELNVAGSYRHYIVTDNQAVSYLVQAAYADKLQWHTWWFPVVGDVPYLGFFDKADRDQEAQRLKAEGYDVALGMAGAFSSLGYFDDPVFSSMLKNSDIDLVHLLLHELVHRTVWVKGSARFNETLAEYGAQVLTTAWLQQQHQPEKLALYEAQWRDRALFLNWMSDLKKSLQKLYEHPPTQAETLKEEKQKIFSDYLHNRLPKFETTTYQYLQRREWNNATVLASDLYNGDFSEFITEQRCFGMDKPLGEFLKALQKVKEQSTKASLCG